MATKSSTIKDPYAPANVAARTLPAPKQTSDPYSPANVLAKAIPSKIQTPAPAPTSTPYFAAVDKTGNSFGFSDTEKDVSGKPFFAFRAPKDTSTTTDKTRVATTFDPRVPSKVTRDDFYNPRAVNLREKFKTSMGIAYNEELDHKIALALSGSNDATNLRPTKNNNDSPIISDLQQKVISGKMSLFDAQIELAKKKGFTVPFTGIKEKSIFMQGLEQGADAQKNVLGVTPLKQEPKPSLGANVLNIFGKAVAKPFIQASEDINALRTGEISPTDVAKEIPSAVSTVAKGVQTGITDVAKAFIQYPLRTAAEGTLSFMKYGEKRNAPFSKIVGGIPDEIKLDPYLAAIFGADKLETFQKKSKEIGITIGQLGGTETEQKILPPAIIAIGGFLDYYTGGEAGFLSKKAAEAIAKSTEEKVIADILKKEIKNLNDPAAEAFARVLKKVNDPEKVQTVLNRINYQASKMARPDASAPAIDIFGKDAKPKPDITGMPSAEDFLKKNASIIKDAGETAKTPVSGVPQALQPIVRAISGHSDLESFQSALNTASKGGTEKTVTLNGEIIGPKEITALQDFAQSKGFQTEEEGFDALKKIIAEQKPVEKLKENKAIKAETQQNKIITQQKLPEPEKTKVEKPTESPLVKTLAEEAKKYKSVEEFVASQPKLFHGAPEVLSEFRPLNTKKPESLIFTTNKGTAQAFGKDLNEVSVNLKKPFVFDAKGEKMATARIREIIKENDINPQDNIYSPYDGLVIKNIKGYGGEEWTIPFRNESVKTKSQLTDIYNKAKEQGKAPIEAYKKTTFFSRFNQHKSTLAEIEKLIDEVTQGKGVRLIFRDELIDSKYHGKYTGTRPEMKEILKPMIELYQKKGKVRSFVALHESGHYFMDNFMSEAEKKASIALAWQKMPIFDRAGYKLSGYTKDQYAHEWIADQYAKSKMKEKNFTGPLEALFRRIDEIIKNILDIFEKAKKLYQLMTGPEGRKGFAKNPFASEPKRIPTSYIDEFYPMEKGVKISDPDKAIYISDVRLTRKQIKHIVEQRKKEGKTPEQIKKLFSKVPETITNPEKELPNPDSDYPGSVKRVKFFEDMLRGVVVILDKKTGDIRDIITAFTKKPQDYRSVIKKSLENVGETPSLSKEGELPSSTDLSTSVRSGRRFSDLQRSQETSTEGAAKPLSFLSQPGRLSGVSEDTLPTKDAKVKETLPTGPIKSDYKEIQRGQAEIQKIDAKESKQAREEAVLAPFQKEIENLQIQRDILRGAIESNKAIKLLRYFGKKDPSDYTLAQVMRSSLGTDKKSASLDEIADSLGFQNLEDAQVKLDEFIRNREKEKALNREINSFKSQLANVRSEGKDMKSLSTFLHRSKAAKEIEKIRTLEAKREKITKEQEQTDARIKKEIENRGIFQNKIKQAQIQEQKKNGFFGKIKQVLRPIESFDPKTKEITQNWFDNLLQAKEKGQKAYEENASKGPQTMNAIHEYQSGSQERYIREAFDEMGTDFKRRGLEFDWISENYVPQVWMENSDFVGAAKRFLIKKGMTPEEITSYMAGEELSKEKALRLKLRPNFVKDRFWPDYKTGMEHGLKPKYRSPAQLIGHYKEVGERALANKKYISQLKEEAKLLTEEDAPDTWIPITRLFSQNQLYGSPELAKMINGRFRDESNLSLTANFKKGLAGVSRFMFDVKTLGGIPYTTVNSFAIGQAIKAGTTMFGDLTMLDFNSAMSNLKSMFAFIRANSDKASIKFFEEKRNFITLAAKEGLDLFQRPGSFESVGKKLSDAFIEPKPGAGFFTTKATQIKNQAKRFGTGFYHALGDKTIKNMLPMITLQTFKDTFLQAIKAGASEKEASKFAAEVTKKFLGITGEVGRGLETTDTLNAVLTAPYFREGVLNSLWNAGKGWSSGFGDATFYRSRRLLLGMLAAYVAYNALNYEENGEFMWDNPPGREWQLRIPVEKHKWLQNLGLSNQDVFYIDYMPSFFAIARNLGSAGINLFRGNFDVSTQKIGSIFSTPIQLTTELATNKDYFGRAIYKNTDSTKEKLTKLGVFSGLSLVHPYMLEMEKYLTGQQPFYQTFTRMAELPIKFSSLTNEQKSEYYAMLDKQSQARADAKKPILAIYEKNQQLKADGKTEEANAIYKTLSESDRTLYDQIKSDMKRKNTNARKPAIQAIYETNQALIKDGRIDQANEIYSTLSEEDKRIYGLIKANVKRNAVF